MDTAPLKSFATSARTELIREVGARITAVLAQGSPERVEQPRAVNALERAIAAGGGGDKGKAHIADKVAYTWFNRVIALRFMDAKGYTGIGVVSPAADQVGQPEVLAAAKRGQVDSDVVKGANATIVPGLLNGTSQPRPGVDAQAEAYALLLADYCRYWNRAMPFMFEREGDYTELLIPANLLAEDSVLSRSVKVLTEDVCQDVEVIGWLYQFYISERKEEVFKGFDKGKKAGADEIPAATQLFTPHWIVRYLVENSLGRLWMLNHPQSRLAGQMDFYIAPVDEETDFLKISTPEELKVIDPACGSGHMLTYAFDLLDAIYEEEGYTPSQIPSLILTNNLYGTEIDQRAGALAAFALTMKAAAKRKLFLKKPVEPNVCVLDPISFSADERKYLVTKDGDRHAEEAFWDQFAEADTLGSLIQPDPALTVRLAKHLATLDDEGDLLRADALGWAQRVITQATYLTGYYAVAVTNPPYMGSQNMGATLARFGTGLFPDSKRDLFSMFIERSRDFTVAGGMLAMITMQGWMFISSFASLRAKLMKYSPLRTMVHLGERSFDSISGSVVSTTAFVAEVGGPAGVSAVYVRATSGDSEEAKGRIFVNAVNNPDHPDRYVSTSAAFSLVPGAPVAYWLSDEVRGAFGRGVPLGEAVNPRQGLATGDNDRFVRSWWEVGKARTETKARNRNEFIDSGARWVPFIKGGGYRKWWGNREYVLAFSNSDYDALASQGNHLPSKQFYFQRSASWSKVGTNNPAFRYYPEGFVFETGGGCVFAEEDSSLVSVLALGNSSSVQAMLEAIAPGVSFQIGDIRRLPFAEEAIGRAGLHSLVDELIYEFRSDASDFEIDRDFGASPILALNGGSLQGSVGLLVSSNRDRAERARRLESDNNRVVAEVYGISGHVFADVPLSKVSLASNAAFRYSPERLADDPNLEAKDAVIDFVSYLVGCMFGRYSLDEPGLILADQGATLQDYLARVPLPTFEPDADNVIPIVDGDWFEDDIVERFRLFLRTVFGAEHLEENLRFVTESLVVKHLRDYFIKTASTRSTSAFYDDHIRRYKKRPIYWLFSSPKGSFNALIYMHRYTPSTVSTVLAYLREYVTKLESALQQAERLGNAKEADRLRKILIELNEYEHDTLYPKASENVFIDLDDGVKANYPKFGDALRKIPGLSDR